MNLQPYLAPLSTIDWTTVAIVAVLIAVVFSLPALVRLSDYLQVRRERKELEQRFKESEQAFYAGLIDKYPATLSPEEVAFFNGPAYRIER